MDENTVELNIIPFVCEAIGHNRLIYNDIDKIYSQKKYEFHKLAKENEFYNSLILTDNDFIKEEYAKKILGIILYIMNNVDNESTGKAFYDLTEKGWSYTYSYIQNNTTFNFDHYMPALFKKINGLDKISADELNHNSIIAFFLAHNFEKKIIDNDSLYRFQKMLYDRQNFSKDDSIKIRLPNADDIENLDAIKQLRNKLIGNQNLFFDTLYSKYNKLSMDKIISFMFDYEGISTSICDGQLSSKDIDEIIWAIKVIDVDDLENKFLVSSYIRLMLKKFKELKQYYLENNKETMYVELDEIQKENTKLKAEIELLKKDNFKNQNTIERQEKQIKKLQQKISDSKLYDQELYSLREFIFNLNNEVDDPQPNINEPKKIDNKILILGGHENWQNRMKEFIPAAIFINAENLNYDTNIIQNVEAIFIYTNYLNHGIYYKTIPAAKRFNKPIYYINSSNDKIVLKDIEKHIK